MSLLAAQGLSKSYGQTEALKDVDFVLEEGQSVAVIGENGAGKSTFAKIIAGAVRPDSGSIEIKGEPVDFGSPRDALHHGVAFIPQELAYFPNMSVAENVLVGSWPSRFGITRSRAIRRQAELEARDFGIDIDFGRPMGSLKIGELQLVEIVKALARRAKLVLLDEPTASLSGEESSRLFGVLRNLTRQGVGIIYISHRMDEAFRFSDRVDILRDGRLVASESSEETTPEQLIEHMLGHAASRLSHRTEPSVVGESVVRLVDWSSPGPEGLSSVSLDVARGEIVGLFGLRGAGQELIAEGLAGLHRNIQGRVVVGGREFPVFSTPRASQAAGISFVPAERKRDGLVLPLSVQANLGLMVLKRISSIGILNARAERVTATPIMDRLKIRAHSTAQAVAELSGGNQQKVLVGSRLLRRSAMLVLHEPTRGVDVGAREEIHRFLRQLVEEGAAILLVTSDVEEAVFVSDRLLIMRDGELVIELSGEEKTQSHTLSAATEAA